MIRAVAFAVWLAACFTAATSRADDARVKVATLDGVPVYHWRVFHSKLVDDVDRALVIREFERKGFKLPERLVNEGVGDAIRASGGDEVEFAARLHRQGVTLADYRRFIVEEITVEAMLYQKIPDEAAKARWLAALRTHTRVVRLQAAPHPKG